MSKEEMKLALDALERYQVKRQDFDRFAEEITALREALAQPAQQEPVARVHTAVTSCKDCPSCGYETAGFYSCAAAASRRFLAAGKPSTFPDWCPLPAQPAQQPVNAKLREALQQVWAEIWRLLDAKGIDPKQARQWPEIIILEAAITKATGGTP